MITNKLITDCHNIAIGLAPRRSGNLRNNAIRITNRRKNGFTIRYSTTDAYYIKYVEEGTFKKDGTVLQPAQGFIEKTVLNLSNYLHAIGQGAKDKYKYENATLKRMGNRELYTENTDYRRLIHRQSIFQHYQNEGRDTLYRKLGDD